jgi:hypothetical protein
MALRENYLLTADSGPIQCSPRASPNWQGCQEVQQVLSDFLMGFIRHGCMGFCWLQIGMEGL